MRKILIFSLLFAMLAVPASAMSDAERKELDKWDAYTLQSFGWKCDKILNYDSAIKENENPFLIAKLECENGLVYFKKMYAFPKGDSEGRLVRVEYCHKGVCKKFE